MKYALLALDVDGVVVAADNRVPPDTAGALADAARAGLRVCLATGRSFAETIDVWEQLHLPAPYEPLVLVGGALVSEADTGRTLRQSAIPRDLACRFADALAEANLPAMALVDAWRHGVDYYVAGGGGAAEAAWFSKMSARVRRHDRLWDARGMPEPLRVSTVVDEEQAEALAAALAERFRGRLGVHAIRAPNYDVTIVEAFRAGVDKAAGVRYVAQAYGIGPGAVAAVGDDVNDLELLRLAGLSAAMPHAPEAVRAAADVVVGPSVGAFVRSLAAGEVG
jgi:hypothetical protein